MIYTVQIPPNESTRSEAAIFIPEGSAPWALLAPPIWLAIKRLWWPLVFYMIVLFALFVALTTPFALWVLAISGIPGIYLLVEGHELVRRKLERQGWQLVDVIEASSPEIAEQLWLSRQIHLPGKTSQKSGVPVGKTAFIATNNPPDDLAFGLFAEE